MECSRGGLLVFAWDAATSLMKHFVDVRVSVSIVSVLLNEVKLEREGHFLLRTLARFPCLVTGLVLSYDPS